MINHGKGVVENSEAFHNCRVKTLPPALLPEGLPAFLARPSLALLLQFVPSFRNWCLDQIYHITRRSYVHKDFPLGHLSEDFGTSRNFLPISILVRSSAFGLLPA
jgi:hypothetical protein